MTHIRLLITLFALLSSLTARAEDESADTVARRAMKEFREGDMTASAKDFDALVKLRPDLEPQLWQRGIALYYAGRYADGVKQFETHQTVNSNDVENAVWHFLCVAKAKDLTEARKSLINIKHDSRPPLMKVLALFKGECKEQDVLDDAKAGNPEPEQLKVNLFYAHLYLGLYYEATGDAAASRKHIEKAVNDYPAEMEMLNVAKAHLKLRKLAQ